MPPEPAGEPQAEQTTTKHGDSWPDCEPHDLPSHDLQPNEPVEFCHKIQFIIQFLPISSIDCLKATH